MARALFKSWFVDFNPVRAKAEGRNPGLPKTIADLFKYRSAIAWRVLAYRRPGATIAEANAELDVFAKRFGKDFPDEPRNLRFQAVPEQRARPDPSAMDFAL